VRNDLPDEFFERVVDKIFGGVLNAAKALKAMSADCPGKATFIDEKPGAEASRMPETIRH
jgi:hypothetical protein